MRHVVIDNLHVTRWYLHGITTPTNYENQEPEGLILRNNTISDCDGIGINLEAWLWNLGGNSGWRGGFNLSVLNNTITRTNHMGINLYSRDSLFSGNQVSDIALIANLGASGMGCGLSQGQGFCTEFGDGIRIKGGNEQFTAFGNAIEHNRIERTGYCGIDVFGGRNIIRENLFVETCYSKGDCGAVRTFGVWPIETSPVFDVEIRNNVILDTVGNTDGCRDFFDPPFGIGLYIDFYSRNITVDGNTVAGSTIDGVLYQNSTGQVTNNTLFNNNTGTMERGQLYLEHGPTALSSLTDNIFYGQNSRARTISTDSVGRISNSDRNFFFNPFTDTHILAEFAFRTFSEWRALSGQDGNSITNDFSLNPGDEPLGTLFANGADQSQTVDLGGVIYRDLAGNPVTGSIQLGPYSSRVLIDTGESTASASVSGDATVCVGGSASLTVVLEGAGPWRLVWSDGITENNISSSPHSRVVNPTQTTTYSLTSVSDSRGPGGVSGSATVTIGTGDPLSVQPRWAAVGVMPPRFTAAIPCNAVVTSLQWRYGGQTLGTGNNPFTLAENQYNGNGSVAVEVATSNLGNLGVEAYLLVAPTAWRDRNSDGCNSIADLRLAASQWATEQSGDPDGNGRINVLDLLYINTSGDCLPARKADTLFIRTASTDPAGY
nr:right-handed parallel beta-helix repeat-containing protein [Acanthopleuribacter pedis]